MTFFTPITGLLNGRLLRFDTGLLEGLKTSASITGDFGAHLVVFMSTNNKTSFMHQTRQAKTPSFLEMEGDGGLFYHPFPSIPFPEVKMFDHPILCKHLNLQGINISHQTGKGNSSSKLPCGEGYVSSQEGIHRSFSFQNGSFEQKSMCE